MNEDKNPPPGQTGLPARRWNILWFVLALGLFLYTIRGVMGRLAKHTRLDFYHFYEGAKAVAGGTDLYASGSGGYIYPPFFAFLLSPLARVPHDTAALIWLAVNILLIAAILAMGLRVLSAGFGFACGRWQGVGICSLAVLLSSEQVRWELILGQSDTLTLTGFALCLYLLERWPLAAGMALGATANVKYQAVLALPYFLFRGRWMAAAGLLAGFVLGALLPAVVIGWDKNLEYLGIAFGGMAAMVGVPVSRAAAVPDLLWERSITITSGLARVFAGHGWPQGLAFPAVLVVAGLVCLGLWWMFRRSGIPFFWRTPATLGDARRERAATAIEWCALLMGLLVFSPQGTKRHLFLMLSVNLLVALLLVLPRPGVKRWPLLAGLIIAQLGLRLPSKDISEAAAEAWNNFGGPSWCLLVFLLLVVWSALERLPERRTRE